MDSAEWDKSRKLPEATATQVAAEIRRWLVDQAGKPIAAHDLFPALDAAAELLLRRPKPCQPRDLVW